MSASGLKLVQESLPYATTMLQAASFWQQVASQGPVVQSIVSLTSSLGCQLVKYKWTTLSNML